MLKFTMTDIQLKDGKIFYRAKSGEDCFLEISVPLDHNPTIPEWHTGVLQIQIDFPAVKDIEVPKP